MCRDLRAHSCLRRHALVLNNFVVASCANLQTALSKHKYADYVEQSTFCVPKKKTSKGKMRSKS